MAATKTAKTVQVIATFYHKRDGKLTGTVSYLVKSSDGKSQYCCTLVDGKASGCSCPARGNKCYHRVQLESKAAARKEIASQFKAASVPTWMVQLVDAGTIVAPSHVEMVVQPVAPLVFESVKIGKVLLSDKSSRRRGGTIRQVEQAEHMARMADEIAEIKQRKAAEAGNLYKPFAMMR